MAIPSPSAGASVALSAAPGPPRRPEESVRARRRTVRAWLIDVYAALDAHPRIFRPLLLGIAAAAVGLMVAPDLRLRAYPVDAALLGAPMVENIKAPYDVEVVDTWTTERLRDEASAQVRPIFRFDREAAARNEQRVSRAFAAGRAAQSASALLGEPKAQAKATERVALREQVTEAWGVALPDPSWQALRRASFDPAIERALCGLVQQIEAEPTVGNRSSLEVGRERGIVIEHSPGLLGGEGSAERPPVGTLIVNLQQVADVAQAKDRARDLGRALERDPRFVAEHGAIGEALGLAVASLLEANLAYDRSRTELLRAQARSSVRPVTIAVKKGEMVVRDGERLTQRHLVVLTELNAHGQSGNVLAMAMGGVILLIVLCALGDRLTGFLRRDVGTLSSRDLSFLTSLFLLSLALCRVWLFFSHGHDRLSVLPREVVLFGLPVAFAPMVARLVLRAEIALLFSVLHSLVLGLLADGDRMLMIYALCGSVAATGAIQTISSRSDLLRAGLYAGLTQAVAAFGIQLFETHATIGAYVFAPLAAVAGGLMAAVLALSLTPLVEWAFDYTTDLKLLELANLNHPALKELIVQAPGSYHHSIIVGALVEAAADNIGANSLLARVMAYYHDLGKGCNPAYFIENQRSGQNPHDKLKPSMSAMIIRRHVSDGIELAKRHSLGEHILAGIAQHHGNTLIRVFYHKAVELAEPGQSVQEADYRYPGTKPQTREAALVMLGDSIEAASRALAEPDAARLTGLVQRIIIGKFTDGQLDECDLTLRDLHTIAKSFSRVLLSIYHHRLEYPEPTAEAKKSGRGEARGEPDGRSRPTSGEPQAPPGDAPSTLRRLGL